jgi:hypothetical protein
MNIRKILFSILFLILFISLPTSKSILAADLSSKSILNNSIFLKIKEKVQYFLTFGSDKKVAVLEKQAENRLNIAQDHADNGNQIEVQNSLQNYLGAKEKQDTLLNKVDNDNILESVQERTVNQQKVMEEIKTKVDKDAKQEIIRIQEQVVNQVAQRVIEVNGKEGQTEFFNKVEHVWAPGTGPGGEGGVVYEGGARHQYAPGTSAGSGGIVIEGGEMKFATGASMDSPGADVKNIEIKSN